MNREPIKQYILVRYLTRSISPLRLCAMQLQRGPNRETLNIIQSLLSRDGTIGPSPQSANNRCGSAAASRKRLKFPSLLTILRSSNHAHARCSTPFACWLCTWIHICILVSLNDLMNQECHNEQEKSFAQIGGRRLRQQIQYGIVSPMPPLIIIPPHL